MIPEKTFFRGWPEHLVDNAGDRYVRLRDGKPTGEFTGASCLYGRLDDDGYVERDRQWIPLAGVTEQDMRLTGSTWSTPSQLADAGQPPISIPRQPVEWPE